jgi:hypothetical protein
LQSGGEELLALLTAPALQYVRYASEHFEIKTTKNKVQEIYDHQPLTQTMISALNPEVALDDIRSDLVEIGYPLAKRLRA